jgi:uncharacterized membrane protein
VVDALCAVVVVALCVVVASGVVVVALCVVVVVVVVVVVEVVVLGRVLRSLFNPSTFLACFGLSNSFCVSADR